MCFAKKNKPIEEVPNGDYTRLKPYVYISSSESVRTLELIRANMTIAKLSRRIHSLKKMNKEQHKAIKVLNDRIKMYELSNKELTEVMYKLW